MMIKLKYFGQVKIVPQGINLGRKYIIYKFFIDQEFSATLLLLKFLTILMGRDAEVPIIHWTLLFQIATTAFYWSLHTFLCLGAEEFIASRFALFLLLWLSALFLLLLLLKEFLKKGEADRHQKNKLHIHLKCLGCLFFKQPSNFPHREFNARTRIYNQPINLWQAEKDWSLVNLKMDEVL